MKTRLQKVIAKFQDVWDQYCATVSRDHHKSRDFQYQFIYDGDNEGGSWSIEHDGYINYHRHIVYGGSLEDAIEEFIITVEKWINDWKESE